MSDGGPWTLADIPDLTGKRALVTGVTSGIGEQTVLELARRGAEVILGARNASKLETSISRIREAVPGARLHPLSIDVSDLSSIRRAVRQVDGTLNLLINNAGVMATPHERTADGLELQMATNHFGPFALTGLLFPTARRLGRRQGGGGQLPGQPPGPQASVGGSPEAERSLQPLVGVLQVQARRPDVRLRARPPRTRPPGAGQRPGGASGLLGDRADGQRRNTGNTGERKRMSSTILQAVFEVAGQPPELGALPTLMAATADLPGSTYVGPSGLMQMKGLPRIVAPAAPGAGRGRAAPALGDQRGGHRREVPRRMTTSLRPITPADHDAVVASERAVRAPDRADGPAPAGRAAWRPPTAPTSSTWTASSPAS